MKADMTADNLQYHWVRSFSLYKSMSVCRGPHLGSGTRLRAGLRAGLRNGLRNGLLIGLRIVKQYLSAGSGSCND